MGTPGGLQGSQMPLLIAPKVPPSLDFQKSTPFPGYDSDYSLEDAYFQ